MTTISTTPALPMPNRQVSVSFGLSGSADFARVWCTDAPAGSTLRKRLDTEPTTRIHLTEVDGGKPWVTDFDKGGAYSLVIQEYEKFAEAHGGSYEGDPRGAPAETKVGSESTVKLYIGQRLESPIGLGNDNAKLVVWVWDATIRPTTVSLNGEQSPAIINASTPRAATAASSTAVRAALTALHNTNAVTSAGTAATVLADIVSKFNLHRSQASVHAANDTDNAIPTWFGSSATPQKLAVQVANIASALTRHIQNDDDGSGIGSAATDYHSGVDWPSVPVLTGASTPAQVYAAIADLWRCYELHRTSSAHSVSDTTNTLSAIPAMMNVHRRFLEVLTSLSPTVPESQSTAATALAFNCGFVETN